MSIRARLLTTLRLTGPALIVALCAVSPARAQSADTPIAGFVVDLRGALAPYGQSELLAGNLGVASSDLPPRALGLDLGGHWYFLRWRAITFGVGGSLHLSSAEHQTQADPTLGIVEGPLVRTRLRGFMPQVSFNFGTGRGWSYLSGGISPLTLGITVDEQERQSRSTKTINYGGGARWFAKPHLAFTIDVRFYAMNPLAEQDTLPGTPRTTLLVVSSGISIR